MLLVEAWVDEQLEQQARAWIADESGKRFYREARSAHISQAFDWFAEDFERDAGSVLAWIAAHGPAERLDGLRTGAVEVAYLAYDGSLDQKEAGAPERAR